LVPTGTTLVIYGTDGYHVKMIDVIEDSDQMRDRILSAAFTAFTDNGYAEASVLEIATRAQVSKREIYARIGNKQELLVACIRGGAERFRLPELPAPRSREELAGVLEKFGEMLLREVSNPNVVTMFRLAVAESQRSPEVARALDSFGRESARSALRQLLSRAKSAKLIAGDVRVLSERFAALLWGDLLINLMLRLADTPKEAEIRKRARAAAEALLQLHPAP
jgi:AcrR family transcriptional regulator